MDSISKNLNLVLIAKHLLENAGSAKRGENILILFDQTTIELLPFFKAASLDLQVNLNLLELELMENHGSHIDESIYFKMRENDLVLALLQKSIAHTKIRMNFNQDGGRFLSLPDYSIDMFSHPSITFDYKSQLNIANKITEMLSVGNNLEVKSDLGTSLFMNIKSRKANCCPGFVDSEHLLGSPPDVESNISPVEEESEGLIVVDGSITIDSIGLLKTPVELEIKKGSIKNFKSKDSYLQETCENIFMKIRNSKAYVLAECGIGLNPKSNLTGKMLTDEGTLGSIHFGFGSNITVGGKNDVPFHLDFVITKPDLFIDGFRIIKKGKLQDF